MFLSCSPTNEDYARDQDKSRSHAKLSDHQRNTPRKAVSRCSFKHLINLVQESETSIRRLEEKDTERDIFASDTAGSVSFIISLNCMVGLMLTNTV